MADASYRDTAPQYLEPGSTFHYKSVLVGRGTTMIRDLYDGLAPDVAASLRDAPPAHVFSVITWGCAASQWLTDVLNAHPDILCVHALNQQWKRFGAGPFIDGPEYLRMLGAQAFTVAAAGDVHGVNRSAIAQCRTVFGDGFGCAVVVREPLVRLGSMLSGMEKVDWQLSWDLSYLDGLIASRVRLPEDSYKNRLTVHCVNMLNAIVEEAALARVFRSEYLTGRPESLSALVEEVTGGKVRPEPAWSETCIRRPPVNPHAPGKRAAVRFEPWQIEVIRAVVLPKAWALYEQLGYRAPDFL